MQPIDREELISALMREISRDQDPELYENTLRDFRNATDQDLNRWYNQQNDPGQMRENAWTAQEDNLRHTASTDLANRSYPPMDESQRDAVLKEISRRVDVLTQQLSQEQKLEQKLEHER